MRSDELVYSNTCVFLNSPVFLVASCVGKRQRSFYRRTLSFELLPVLGNVSAAFTTTHSMDEVNTVLIAAVAGHDGFSSSMWVSVAQRVKFRADRSILRPENRQACSLGL